MMGGPPSQPLPGVVAPNEDVDLSVALMAPTTDGIHRGNWKLRNPSDVVFGIGKDAPFFVQIIVGPTFTPSASGETVFDMAARFARRSGGAAQASSRALEPWMTRMAMSFVWMRPSLRTAAQRMSPPC